MNKFIKPIAPGNKEGSPYTFVNPENLIPDLNSIADDRLRRAAEESSRLGIDRAHFWNMLVSYMPKSGFDYKHEVVHIIDIGCGVCKEAPVLNAYFGRKPFGSFSENVYITGIDIDDQSINQSIRLYTDFQTRRIPEQFRFVRENALSSRCLSTLTPFQVIVVRHPNISECNTFETALKFIDPEGLIIITTFQDYERDLVVESLEKNGCNITVNTENIWARPIDNDALMERNGLMIDKHIIMAIAGCPQRRQ